MIIGTVIGNVWATRKNEKLNGLKFLVVEPVNILGEESLFPFVAVDIIGAGIGDRVIVTKGSSARASFDIKEIPIDAAIIGIVDNLEVDSRFVNKL